MNNQGLLFIPDISGFTEFINQTEIEHNRLIIQELLETLINANCLRLKISEIEGDAILFYRFGKPPALHEMYKQVETMFCNFHRQLKEYSERRICQCRACKNAKDLTLKVVSHYGEFSTYSVREFSKLIGKDVIKAHQLLKNDIPLHEYWLVTDGLWQENTGTENLPEWMEWRRGNKHEAPDNITFHYSFLTPLKENLLIDSKNKFGIPGPRQQVLSVRRTMEENMEDVFHVVADLSKRAAWVDGIKAVENISTPMPEVGTVHHCIMEKGRSVLITSDFQVNDQRIIMEETDKRKIGTCQVVLEKTDEHLTSMTFNFFIKENFLVKAMFDLFMRKKLKENLERSLENLEAYLKFQKTAALELETES